VFVLYIFFPDGPQLMPQEKHCSYRETNPNADQEKPPISRERDQQNPNYGDGDDQTARTFEPNPTVRRLRTRLHTPSMVRFYRKKRALAACIPRCRTPPQTSHRRGFR